MVARANRRRSSLLAALCSLPLIAACEQSPLVAPTGSTIVITASTNVLPVNASTQIVAQVLEAAGTPPHSGTIVTFTTTLGSFEPFEVSTDAGGRAIVKFLTGPANGSAVITATSGAATTGTNGSLRISIGTAAVGRVSVNASPALVPANGGSTTITASVFDVNGNTLRSAPVSFTTTAGTLSASLVEADANGAASATLTTAQQATVTASVGALAPTPTTGGGTGTGGTGTGGTGTGGTTAAPASSGQASGSVVVNIASAPALVITPPTAPPSAGLPANFTFAVTPAAQNGSAIKDLRVNWGDGESSNLGAVTGTANASHVYEDDGTFTVTATVTDVSGNSVSVSTSVAVIPVPRPTVVVTASPSNTFVNNEVTITIQVTAAPGIGIQRTTIAFGDGETRELGGASSISVAKQYASPGVFTVRVNVLDTAGNVTEGTTRVSVN